VVRRDERRHDRRATGAEPSREWDLGADAKGEPVHRVDVGKRAHAQVAAVSRQRGVARVDRELAGLLDLEGQVQRQRRRHRVEARPEVG
jgi:hypothetical protein